MRFELVPYDAWTPETIALEKIKALPWANEKTLNKATSLARGLIRARKLGLTSQVNLYFANLKRLAKRSASDTIRQALDETGLAIRAKGMEQLEDPAEHNGLIPPDMLDLMEFVGNMLPMAQFRIGVVNWQRDPYLLVGIPGGKWFRIGSWEDGDRGHILVDAGKVDLHELLGT